jgi:hypothetical protein
MVSNPHIGTPSEAGWAMGFAFGFVGPAFSTDPPLVIAPELIEAFQEGTLAGQQAAIDGLAIEPACVSLSQEASAAAEELVGDFHKAELLDIGIQVIRARWAEASVGALVFAFLLMIPSEPPLPDAASAFPRLALSVRNQLEALGINSGSMFFGTGIDENEVGCELLMTPIFKSLDQARDATIALGRTQWLIAEWAADNVSSFNVVETSADK